MRNCDCVYLDTTYAAPKHAFPPQGEAIAHCADVIAQAMAKPVEERPLVLVAAYSIGKERILVEAARRCGVRVGVEHRRMSTLVELGMPSADLAVFTESDAPDVRVRIVGMDTLGETFPYFKPNWSNCDIAAGAVGAPCVVGIVPSGWMLARKGKSPYSRREKGDHTIHLVPYSEHSSFEELRQYVKFLKPVRIRPTVYSNERESDRIVARFRDLVDSTGAKHAFLGSMTAGGKSKGNTEGAEREDSSVAEGANTETSRKEHVPPPGRITGSASGVGQSVGRQLAPSENAPTTQPQQPRSERSQGCVGAKGSGMEERVERLIAVCGITPEQARTLLRDTNGDMEAAANNHYLQQESAALSAHAGDAHARTSADSPAWTQLTSPKRTASRAGAHAGTPSKRSRRSSGGGASGGAGGKQTGIMSFFRRGHLGGSNAATGAPGVSAPLSRQACSAAALMARPPAPTTVGAPSLPPSPQPEVHAKTVEAAPSLGIAPGSASQDAPSDVAEFDSVRLPCWRYSPHAHSRWRRAEATPWAHLAAALKHAGAEQGRLRKIDTLANCWRAVMALTPPDVLPCVLLATGRVAAAHEDLELGVGGASVSSAVMEATGATKGAMREAYRRCGDLGDVAAEMRTAQRTLAAPAPLTVPGIYKTLLQIAREGGQGSAARRHGAMVRLLRAARGADELRYLVRILLSNLRIGATDKLVLASLAKASVLHRAGVGLLAAAGRESGTGPASTASAGEAAMKQVVSQAQEEIATAYTMRPSMEIIVKALVEGGIEAVSAACHLTPGAPVLPMLARPCNGAQEVHARLALSKAGFVAQYKYDGMRAQVHLMGHGEAKVFSRSCEDSTEQFEDAVRAVSAALQESEEHRDDPIVVDCEIVAVDRAETPARILPFQTLATKAKTAAGQAKKNASEGTGASVDVCVYVFDVLFLGTRSLVHAPLSERLERLRAAFPKQVPGVLEHAEQRLFCLPNVGAVSAESRSGGGEAEERELHKDLSNMLMESIGAGCEGLMCKAMDSTYEPSKRSDAWLKVKRDYVAGLADSLDLVPIGAWYGNGRKAGWFSPWLLAAVDPATQELHCVCRVMSGFSDDFYRRKTAEYKDKLVDACPAHVRTGEACSVWFDPFEVWEIRGADITLSPVHAAGLGKLAENTSRGLSLRFPRFLRERPDKTPSGATTVDEFVEMFSRQAQRLGAGGPSE